MALEGWEQKMGERTIFTEPQGVSMTRVFNIPNTWSRMSSPNQDPCDPAPLGHLFPEP